MIYITGDTHSEFSRFNTQNFPEQKEMTRDDYVLIAGDFGGVWDFDYRYAADVPDWMSSHISAYEHGESSREKYWLDWFGKKSFTLCFVDGNHENFERLKKAYPVVDYCGGKAHKLRDNVYHLMRGYVFKLDGKTVFTFGGARSHDISGGILEPKDYPSAQAMQKEYSKRQYGPAFRVNHVSWWAEEMPNSEEMILGNENLQQAGNKVDFILTHSANISTAVLLGLHEKDDISGYLQSIKEKTDYKKWFFGHYHMNRNMPDDQICIYEQIIRIS